MSITDFLNLNRRHRKVPENTPKEDSTADEQLATDTSVDVIQTADMEALVFPITADKDKADIVIEPLIASSLKSVKTPAPTDQPSSAQDKKSVLVSTNSSSIVSTDQPVQKSTKESTKPSIDAIPIIDLNKPEIRCTTSFDDSRAKFCAIGFSIQGRSHIVHEIPCQDYHLFSKLADGWYLAITSDGAGSARESGRGSKGSCELAQKMIQTLLKEKKWIEKNYFPTELEWYIEIRNIFELIQLIINNNALRQAEQFKKNLIEKLSILEKEANEINDDKCYIKLKSKVDDVRRNIDKPLEGRDFNATLILMLVTPEGMLTAHIGDGRMGYLSQQGEWKSLMIPHKGEEASATVFIPNNWNRQQCIPSFQMSDAYLPDVRVIKERPKAFVLMSDGCENFTWRCYTYDQKQQCYKDPNEPHEKFLNPLLQEMKAKVDGTERLNRLIEIINTGTQAGLKEQDDRTILLGIWDD